MENNKNPNIRFKGFTDPWEQRKFTDITFLSGEKNKDNLPYESYSVTNENGFVPQNEQFENGGTMATADKRMYYIVSKNSFAYNPARINVGSIGYYDGPENVIVSSLYEVFKTSEDVDDRYLWHWFKSNNFKKLIEQYQEGGVRLYFYYDKLCMCSLPTPSIQEQIKIGRYFDNLDHLITLHQRKYDKLQNIKKSMLEKMFPKNGSNVPEIRFSGFTDPWEQRKLGDISSLITKGTTPKDKSGTGEVNFIKVENINDYSGNITGMSKISLEEHQGYLKRSQLQEGDILFSIAGTLGRITSVNKAILPANTNQALSIIRLKEGNLEYVKTCLKGNVVADFIRRNPTIGAQPNLSLEQVSNLEIGIPSEAEQKKIGEYFSNLDNLITLHQRELEKLQNIKKSMLEKMFV